MRRGLNDRSRNINSGLFAAEEKEDYSGPDSVSQITRTVKSLLEGTLGRVWVEGEISNFSAPRSGHYYFTLKDEHSAIQCVMWRSSVAKTVFQPEDGIHVEVRGKIAVYEPQGRYQIVCDSIKSVREGTLQQKFEELKARLQEEGLFDLSYKKELPEFPKTIGIVTSGTGAAVRDIIRILKRRMPGINIIVSPCKVQGEGAKEDIAAALGNLDNSGMCDVIIIGRGGGSLEDLWAFNEELVARAVFEAETPIVSAVGHETDFSITDLVADLRAATPSEAAEIVVGDIEGMQEFFRETFKRLNNALQRNLEFCRMRLKNLYTRPVLRDPMTMVMLKEQHIDELAEELNVGLENCLNDYNAKLSLLAAKLQALSPLEVMARGYSLTWLAEKRKLVRNVSEVTIDSLIETNLAEGRILSRVMKVFPD